MGYIPLLIILAAVVALFFMVVNHTLDSKKKTMLQYQNTIVEGLSKLGNQINANRNFGKIDFGLIETLYRKAKTNLSNENQNAFDKEVKLPYQSLKLTIAQYNKLVGKKPYSFVARLMGHKTI